jgi:biopolymer transport protein ExbB
MYYLALFENTLDFFLKGGVFMGLLVICSFVGITVILLRFFALRRGFVIPRLIERAIVSYEPGESVQQIRRLVAGDESALGRIVSVAVRPANRTKLDATDVVQTRARREVSELESGLFILEIVVGISPLLGLLGAVTGLVRVFSNIGSGVTSTSDLKGIASGIGEALSTTIVGLAIAIVALIFYSYFSRRVEGLAVEMESLVTDLIEKLFQPGGSSGSTLESEEVEETEESGAFKAKTLPKEKRLKQATS